MCVDYSVIILKVLLVTSYTFSAWREDITMFPLDQLFDSVTESAEILDMQSSNSFYHTQSISCSC